MDVGKLGSNIINSSDVYKTKRPDPINKDGPMETGAYMSQLQKKFSAYTVGVGIVNENNIPSGARTMTIAPNVLQAMADDPEVAAKYEEFLADYDSSSKQFEQMRAASGQKITASGVFINPDGTTGSYTVSEAYGSSDSGSGRKVETRSLDDMLEKVKERREAQTKRMKALQEARDARRQAEEEEKKRLAEKSQTGETLDASLKITIDRLA